MGFQSYQRVGYNVIACKLSAETEQDILDLLSSQAVSSQLNDFKISVNSTTGVKEFDFRYKDQSNIISLATGDWIIQYPNGDVVVMTDEMFIMNFVNTEVDYIVPAEYSRTFEAAVLNFINVNFADLYAPEVPEGTAVKKYYPVTLDNVILVPNTLPEDASGNLVPTITGINMESAAISLGVTDPVTLAGVLNDTGFHFEFAESLVTKYFIAIGGSNVNPPVAWTVSTRDVDGNVIELASVERADEKTGVYSLSLSAPVNNLTITFKEWEDALVTTNDITVSFYTGGEAVVTSSIAYSELTDDLLDDVKERFVIWYDSGSDIVTVDLQSSGITSFSGFGKVVDKLMTASYIKDSTRFYFNLGNFELVDVQAPNMFGVDALERLSFEVLSLDMKNRDRIMGFSFIAANDTTMSAIASSVTSTTTVLWDNFVSNLINTTGIESANEVKK